MVDLLTGRYSIRSAGHPPVLHWRADAEAWEVDNARGTALGVVEDPEFSVSAGVARAGGCAAVLHRRGRRVAHRPTSTTGIDWLRSAAREAVRDAGMRALPARILDQVTRGDDDRAVLMLARE